MNLLPEIDRDKTIEKIKDVLNTYQFFRLSVPDVREPKITPAWSETGGSSQTFGFHSDTESVAIYNVEKMQYRKQYIETIHKAMHRLAIRDQQIIKQRYMMDEYTTDRQVYMKLNWSERNYYYLRDKALIKLACALRIEEYKPKLQTDCG